MRRAGLAPVLLALLSMACGNEPAASTQADAGSGVGASAAMPGGASAQGGESSAGSSASGAGGVSSAGSAPGGAGGGAGSAPVEPNASKLSDCELAFPYQDENPRGHWLGGDSNFSVVLSASRALM